MQGWALNPLDVPPPQMTRQVFHLQGSRQAWSFCCCSQRGLQKRIPRTPPLSPEAGGAGATDTSLFHTQHTGTKKTRLVLMQSFISWLLKCPLEPRPSNLSLQGDSDNNFQQDRFQLRCTRGTCVLSSSQALLILLPSVSNSWTPPKTSPRASSQHGANVPAVPRRSLSPR